jgi:hypothetical protein
MPAPNLPIRRLSEFDRRRGRRVSPEQVARDAALDLEMEQRNNAQRAAERADIERRKREFRRRRNAPANTGGRTSRGTFAPNRRPASG